MVAAADNPPANSELPAQDVDANDADLRAVPRELPDPQELAERHPGAPLLVAYSRISDDWRQHSKEKAAKSLWKPGKGVANQHRRNEMNAKRNGCVIIRRYTDNDLTAAKASVMRPGFEQMLRDLRRGYTLEGYRVDGVICVDQDRLQRTDSDWERFVEALTSSPGRRLWTPSGPSDLTEEIEIIKAGFMAAVNKAESLKKAPPGQAWPLESKLAELQQQLRGLQACWQGPGPGRISEDPIYRDVLRLEQEISKLQRDRTQWQQDRAEANEPPCEISRKWRSGAYDLAQKRAILFRVFAAVRVDRGQKGCRVPNPRRLHPVRNAKALAGG